MEPEMVAFAEIWAPPPKTSNGVKRFSVSKQIFDDNYANQSFLSDTVWTQKNNLQNIFWNIGFPLLPLAMNSRTALVTTEFQKLVITLWAYARQVGIRLLANRLTHMSPRMARPHGSRVMLARLSKHMDHQVAGSSSTRSLSSDGLTEAGDVCSSDTSDSWSECRDVTSGWT